MLRLLINNVLLWRRWHEVPEVDKILVCVLSIPAFQDSTSIPTVGREIN
jgi:hypothetical protein